jgi:butyryl-CoA dehydrogenase
MPTINIALSTTRRCVNRSSNQLIKVSRRQYTSHSQLPDEYKMIYEMCRSYANEELIPNAGKWDKDRAFPVDAITKLAELGLMGIQVASDYNGSDLDAMSYAIAMEEISRGCASTGVIMSVHNLYLYPVAKYGTHSLKEEFLAPYAKCTNDDGTLRIGCFGLSEPGNGSDAGAATVTAVQDGDSWILNGTKAWTTNAHQASAAIVFATTDKSLK